MKYHIYLSDVDGFLALIVFVLFVECLLFEHNVFDISYVCTVGSVESVSGGHIGIAVIRPLVEKSVARRAYVGISHGVFEHEILIVSGIEEYCPAVSFYVFFHRGVGAVGAVLICGRVVCV